MILLKVPGQLGFKELAARAVSTACKLISVESGNERRSVPEEFTHEAVSAIGEVFNNIVLHGYKDQTPNDIILEIAILDNQLEILVKDYGRSFDPDDAPKPNLRELPESGMGLFIVRAFVDELAYDPGRPNCLRMVKRFAPM